jgi:hypothetical protein
MSASNEGVNDALGGAEAAVPIEQLERSIMQQVPSHIYIHNIN